MSDTPQSEIVKELGLNPTKMGAIRAKHLASTDWWKDPANKNRVMLTPEGVDKLRIYAAAIRDSPQVVPEFIKCRVLGICPNQKQLWIRVDHGEKGYLREIMDIPKKLRGKFHRGKTVRVEVIRGATETIYRHESQGTGYRTS